MHCGSLIKWLSIKEKQRKEEEVQGIIEVTVNIGSCTKKVVCIVTDHPFTDVEEGWVGDS